MLTNADLALSYIYLEIKGSIARFLFAYALFRSNFVLVSSLFILI